MALETNAFSRRKEFLIAAWYAGVEAVEGRGLVKRTLLAETGFKPDAILALGKAAGSMCLGALDVVGVSRSLVITKYDHTPDEMSDLEPVRVIESGHPIPDDNSLLAGRAALEFVQSINPDETLLVLISGGASALAEDLRDGFSFDDLRALNERMIADGSTIEEINRKRATLSMIKGGALLEGFVGKGLKVYGISDVPSNDMGVIGSGIGSVNKVKCLTSSDKQSRVIGQNRDAREAVAQFALSQGVPVVQNEEWLHDDVYNVAGKFVSSLKDGQDGLYIWGGEPTIDLPTDPGVGGRNQSLALAIAQAIKGETDMAVIVAGTDGTDGPTDAAGGVVDGITFSSIEVGRRALLEANAGPFLEARNSLFKSGPTGTNVMDLVIGIKGSF